MHIYTVVSVYECVLCMDVIYGFYHLQLSAGLNTQECFDSYRLSGCWRYFVQNSVDTNWKSFGFWLVGGFFFSLV